MFFLSTNRITTVEVSDTTGAQSGVYSRSHNNNFHIYAAAKFQEKIFLPEE